MLDLGENMTGSEKVQTKDQDMVKKQEDIVA